MTNSFKNFQGSSLGFNTSQTNYLQTEVDMTEAVNTQIDENTKQMNDHFDRMIDIYNKQHEADSKVLSQLADFTQKGFEAYNLIKDIDDTRERYSAILNRKGKDIVKSELVKDQEKLNQAEVEANENEGALATASPDVDPETGHLFLQAGDHRVVRQEKLNQALQLFPIFEEREKSRIRVLMPDGTYKTLDQAEFQWERDYIRKELMNVYVSQFANSGYSEAYLIKYLVEPLYQNHLAWMKKATEEDLAVKKEEQFRMRSDELITKTVAKGGQAVLDYMVKYGPMHNKLAPTDLNKGKFFRVKKEIEQIFGDALKNPEILSVQDWETVKNTPFTPFGWPEGKTTTIGEYFGSEFIGNVDKIAAQAIQDELAVDKLLKEQKIIGWEDENLSNFYDTWKDLDPDKRLNYLKDLKDDFKSEMEPGTPYPQRLKTIETQLELDEDDVLELAAHKLRRTGEVTPDDLIGVYTSDGIAAADELLEASKISIKGKEREAIDKYILSSIDKDYLQGEYLSSGIKGPKLQVLEQYALPYFHQQYESLRINDKQSHGAAVSEALKLTLDKERLKAWDAAGWPGEPFDPSLRTNFKNTLNTLADDPSALFSKKPLPGELVPLEKSYIFVTTGVGEVPILYKTLPKKINGRTWDSHEHMMNRLQSTGMLDKEGKPIPEREKLIPQLQELLLKNPSDSTTYRTILESEDPEWILGLLNAIHPDLGLQTIEDVQQALIDRIYSNNQSISFNTAFDVDDISWLRPVQIDPDLQMQWNEVVGELPTYLQFNSLLSGVATELVNTRLDAEDSITTLEPGEINMDKLNLALDKVVGALSFRDLRSLETQEKSLEKNRQEFNKNVINFIQTVGTIGLQDPFEFVDNIDREILDNLLRSIPTGHDLRPLADQLKSMDKESYESKVLIANLINNLSTMIVGNEQ